uniref:AB hydrolase-1 domain-containing protein n=1 Tax=uncultured marine bacterium MedDCM-OCT-S04-C749 TaxID=743061 RepID=D6PD85_9BACT|nr:hypothetical protein [uncultured marine bacterium MedDCM-OCT-S04-C749]
MGCGKAGRSGESLFKKVKGKNPILVGHSWGALVAMSWAAKYPDEVKGVISVAGLNMPFSGVSKLANDTGLINIAYELYFTNVVSKVDSGSIKNLRAVCLNRKIFQKVI